MLANLATSVIEQERVQTTTAKAKEVRGLVERLITFAKRNDLHARRQVLRVVRKPSVVAKLFDTIAQRYTDRQGGYTRIVHVGQRRGDAAEMSILELVDRIAAGAVQEPAAKGEEGAKTPKPAATPERRRRTRPARQEAEETQEAGAAEAAAAAPEPEASEEPPAETKKRPRRKKTEEATGEDQPA
jgi:large subunit ribosomal protein L17